MPGKGEKTSSSGSGSLPKLLIPRLEAENQIATQIEKGKRLVARPIQSENDLKKATAQYEQWDDYNTDMLRKLFDSSEVAEQYGAFYGGTYSMHPTLQEKVGYYRKDVETRINRLESVKERLHLYEDVSPATVSHRRTALGSDIFVVHGHDQAANQSVARFIEKLGLHPILLQERSDGGRTIIEKLEEESSEVGFAVVLLTPDDIGAPGDKPEDTKSRARQNVIFELGFFVGRLGRDKVCVLHKRDVDIPSDYSGVIYQPMDEPGGWKLKLAEEIDHAGIDVEIDLKKGL